MGTGVDRRDEMRTMSATTIATEFFRTYARALLDRDVKAIANHYAVPALIAAPGQLIAVSDATQTVAFFESAFGQYEGISDINPVVDVVATTRHSLWADVIWSYDGTAAERNMYQLAQVGAHWKIVVLTPRDL